MREYRFYTELHLPYYRWPLIRLDWLRHRAFAFQAWLYGLEFRVRGHRWVLPQKGGD